MTQIAAARGAAPMPSAPMPPTQVLSAVEIQRTEIFDPDEARGWFPRLVNWLHIRTREGVVRREVLLAQGLPFDSARAEETARNLRGLGIFRRVQLDTASTDSGLVVRVLTKDAWSTQLDFGFHSTGNRVLYSLEGREENLLGTGTTLEFQTRRDADFTSRLVHFSGSPLIANRAGLDLEYRDRSDGYSDLLAFSAPFLTQSTPTAPCRSSAPGPRSMRPTPAFCGRCIAGPAVSSASASGPQALRLEPRLVPPCSHPGGRIGIMRGESCVARLRERGNASLSSKHNLNRW
jgi:hypothetical protein